MESNYASNTHHQLIISGVKIRFPYKPYPSQVGMMSKVVSSLKRGENALIESPTGTGKSMALLCASLAWQRAEKSHQEVHHEVVVDSAKNQEELIDPSPPVDQNERMAKTNTPKIIYGTRTHRQISQIIQEFKKSDYETQRMAILGSKKHTCVNPRVSKMENVSLGCQQMMSKAKQGGGVEGRSGAGRGCPFLAGSQKIQSHGALDRLVMKNPGKAWDLEELVNAGRKSGACPHFITRNLRSSSDIIFCPYNYMIDPLLRDKMNINLKGAVLILDEAHNIEESCRAATSLQVEENELREAMRSLEEMSRTGKQVEAHKRMANLCSSLCLLLDSSKSAIPSQSKIFTGSEVVDCLNDIEAGPQYLRILRPHMKRISKVEQDNTSERILPPATIEFLEKYIHLLTLLEGPNSQDYFMSIGKREESHMKKDAKQSIASWVRSGGSRHKSIWQIKLCCLNPGIAFSGLEKMLHCVILSSGTLSPLGSFGTELGVPFPLKLEAAHVIQSGQVFVASLSKGPGGQTLEGNFRNVMNSSYQDEIGQVVEEVCKCVHGGVLLFLPSYWSMEVMSSRWKSTGIWAKLKKSKVVVIEPRDSNSFQIGIEKYCKVTSNNGSALYIGIYRGKVSEGIDFSDNKARAVVCVGIPFPNSHDAEVREKRKYNDTLRCSGQQNEILLSGKDWYEMQAFRALNQSMGRCIRHKNDWGSVVLADCRFQSRNYADNLPKWVRGSVQKFSQFPTFIQKLKRFNEEKAPYVARQSGSWNEEMALEFPPAKKTKREPRGQPLGKRKSFVCPSSIKITDYFKPRETTAKLCEEISDSEFAT